MKKILILLVLLAAAAGGATVLYARFGGSEAAPTFRTAEIVRGDLKVTISATGTVEPEELIDVGAQVVGKIKSIGSDALAVKRNQRKTHLDYTSEVAEGAVLAEIDPLIYQAQRNQAKASLERAKADVLQLKARLFLAKADWRRAQELRNLQRSTLLPAGMTKDEPARPFKAIADSDYDLAKANHDAAESNVKVGEAVVLQQEAALELAETNLGYTVIHSPVKGTIIDRRVEIGQTVVASLNAPSLFLIAKDLRRMEVWTAVNEKDIGRLKVGMAASFTVDAFPKRSFPGTVSQVRLNANNTQNVVTYTVVVSAENPDLALKPYMTASVQFQVETRQKVLLVPNAALRFEPRADQIVGGGNRDEEPAARPGPRAAGREIAPDAASPDVGRVWVAQRDQVRPIDVTLGQTDGSVTEISGEGINEGLAVVTGQGKSSAAASTGTNPFVPSFPGRRR